MGTVEIHTLGSMKVLCVVALFGLAAGGPAVLKDRNGGDINSCVKGSQIESKLDEALNQCSSGRSLLNGHWTLQDGTGECVAFATIKDQLIQEYEDDVCVLGYLDWLSVGEDGSMSWNKDTILSDVASLPEPVQEHL